MTSLRCDQYIQTQTQTQTLSVVLRLLFSLPDNRETPATPSIPPRFIMTPCKDDSWRKNSFPTRSTGQRSRNPGDNHSKESGSFMQSPLLPSHRIRQSKKRSHAT